MFSRAWHTAKTEFTLHTEMSISVSLYQFDAIRNIGASPNT